MPSLCGERRGDPRVVPGFRCPFLPGMPSSLTPGSWIIVAVQNFDIDVAFAERSERLGTPNPPVIRFTRGTHFGASRFTHLPRPIRLLALLYGSDRSARSPRSRWRGALSGHIAGGGAGVETDKRMAFARMRV